MLGGIIQRLVDSTLRMGSAALNPNHTLTTGYNPYNTTSANTTLPFPPNATLHFFGAANDSGLPTDLSDTCPVAASVRYASAMGVDLAVPQWQAILITLVLTVIILVTIVGNILVVLSVFTYKPLRIVQNFFIVSLAVADLTVAILVLPLNVANMVLGRWVFGIHMCKMWLTSDVLCCTSSILNLCAIALDRYWAITDPINYAQKRTVERVLYLIAGVWVLSLVISSPPLIGWNDWPEVFDSERHPCALNSNPGYRVYSALGSFFIPLIIMTAVYIEIYVATRRRLRERAKATRINAGQLRVGGAPAGAPAGALMMPGHGAAGGGGAGGGQQAAAMAAKEPTATAAAAMAQHDQDSISSETNHNEHPVVSGMATTEAGQSAQVTPEKVRKKERRTKAKDSLRLEGSGRGGDRERREEKLLPVPAVREDSCTDVGAENSSESATKQLVDAPALIEALGGKATAAAGAAGAAGKAAAAAVAKKPSTVYQFIEEKQKISLSKERRAARTLGIIMGVFIACWVPFFLLYIIQPFCPSCCPSDRLIDFLTWLGYINSALNPIIYTIFNLDYRRAFKRLLGIKY